MKKYIDEIATDEMMDAGVKAARKAPLDSQGRPGYRLCRAVWDAMVAEGANEPVVARDKVRSVCEALMRIAKGGLQEEADAFTLGQAVGLLMAMSYREDEA